MITKSLLLHTLHLFQLAEIQLEKYRQKERFVLNDFAATQCHFGPTTPIHLKTRFCDQLAQIQEESEVKKAMQQINF